MVLWPKMRQSHGGGAHRPACEARAKYHRRSRGNLSCSCGGRPRMCALGCTCSALRPTVVHPCSCALNYFRGTAAVCLRRAVHDATTTRRVHEGTARSTLRDQVTMRHKQRRGVHGRTVRFGRCSRVLSGGQTVAKTRVDVCRGFSSHVQTLQCVSLCTYCTLPAAVACRSVHTAKKHTV